MSTNKTSPRIITVSAAAIIMLLIFIFYKDEISTTMKQQRNEPSKLTNDLPCKISTTTTQQRNELSKLMNDLKQKYGQQSCQLMSHKKGRQVSEFGGWCREQSRPNSTQHVTDQAFVKALSTFLADKTVGSFGDGPGGYKAGMEALGKVRSYTAYDGAPFVEEVTNGKVNFLDLSAPQYGYPIFDWVLSFEVAEHIPVQFEDIFLDNVVRHARDGVVLSWSKLGQGGYSHVNNKALKDVVKMMETRGFSLNDAMSEDLKNKASVSWLKGNVRVYIRTDPNSLDVNDA